MDKYEKICEFNRKFELFKYANKTPGIIENKEMQELKIKHLREELSEYEAAVTLGDTVGALDALVDLQYVLLGTVIFHGFSPYIWEMAFNRVHIANMKKVRGIGKRGLGCDVVKPEGWEAPKLADLVDGTEPNIDELIIYAMHLFNAQTTVSNMSFDALLDINDKYLKLPKLKD
jgi:hypothetical protein